MSEMKEQHEPTMTQEEKDAQEWMNASLGKPEKDDTHKNALSTIAAKNERIKELEAIAERAGDVKKIDSLMWESLGETSQVDPFGKNFEAEVVSRWLLTGNSCNPKR